MTPVHLIPIELNAEPSDARANPEQTDSICDDDLI